MEETQFRPRPFGQALPIVQRRKKRVIGEMTTAAWERQFTSRKRTVMQKASDMEAATHCQLTVTIRSPAGQVWYYATSDELRQKMINCALIDSSSLRVTTDILEQNIIPTPERLIPANTPEQLVFYRPQSDFSPPPVTPDRNQATEVSHCASCQANRSNVPSQVSRRPCEDHSPTAKRQTSQKDHDTNNTMRRSKTQDVPSQASRPCEDHSPTAKRQTSQKDHDTNNTTKRSKTQDVPSQVSRPREDHLPTAKRQTSQNDHGTNNTTRRSKTQDKNTNKESGEKNTRKSNEDKQQRMPRENVTTSDTKAQRTNREDARKTNKKHIIFPESDDETHANMPASNHGYYKSGFQNSNENLGEKTQERRRNSVERAKYERNRTDVHSSIHTTPSGKPRGSIPGFARFPFQPPQQRRFPTEAELEEERRHLPSRPSENPTPPKPQAPSKKEESDSSSSSSSNTSSSDSSSESSDGDDEEDSSSSSSESSSSSSSSESSSEDESPVPTNKDNTAAKKILQTSTIVETVETSSVYSSTRSQQPENINQGKGKPQIKTENVQCFVKIEKNPYDFLPSPVKTSNANATKSTNSNSSNGVKSKTVKKGKIPVKNTASKSNSSNSPKPSAKTVEGNMNAKCSSRVNPSTGGKAEKGEKAVKKTPTAKNTNKANKTKKSSAGKKTKKGKTTTKTAGNNKKGKRKKKVIGKKKKPQVTDSKPPKLPDAKLTASKSPQLPRAKRKPEVKSEPGAENIPVLIRGRSAAQKGGFNKQMNGAEHNNSTKFESSINGTQQGFSSETFANVGPDAKSPNFKYVRGTRRKRNISESSNHSREQAQCTRPYAGFSKYPRRGSFQQYPGWSDTIPDSHWRLDRNQNYPRVKTNKYTHRGAHTQFESQSRQSQERSTGNAPQTASTKKYGKHTRFESPGRKSQERSTGNAPQTASTNNYTYHGAHTRFESPGRKSQERSSGNAPQTASEQNRKQPLLGERPDSSPVTKNIPPLLGQWANASPSRTHFPLRRTHSSQSLNENFARRSSWDSQHGNWDERERRYQRPHPDDRYHWNAQHHEPYDFAKHVESQGYRLREKPPEYRRFYEPESQAGFSIPMGVKRMRRLSESSGTRGTGATRGRGRNQSTRGRRDNAKGNRPNHPYKPKPSPQRPHPKARHSKSPRPTAPKKAVAKVKPFNQNRNEGRHSTER